MHMILGFGTPSQPAEWLAPKGFLSPLKGCCILLFFLGTSPRANVFAPSGLFFLPATGGPFYGSDFPPLPHMLPCPSFPLSRANPFSSAARIPSPLPRESLLLSRANPFAWHRHPNLPRESFRVAPPFPCESFRAGPHFPSISYA